VHPENLHSLIGAAKLNGINP